MWIIQSDLFNNKLDEGDDEDDEECGSTDAITANIQNTYYVC